MLEEINNILIAVKKSLTSDVVKYNADKKKLYTFFYDQILTIKNDIKITPEIKLEKIQSVIRKAMLDPKYSDLKFSLSVSVQEDKPFMLIYNTFLDSRIKKEALNQETAQNLVDLFPKDYKMSVEDHLKKMNYLIDKLFPEDLALQLKENIILLHTK